MKIQKACKHCSFITEEDTCPLCGNQTSKDWQGYVIIVDHTRSEIAQRMGIQCQRKVRPQGALNYGVPVEDGRYQIR